MTEPGNGILNSTANNILYQKLYRFGFIAYVVMLVLSVLFFKERTILLDSAYTLFNIAKDSSFAINISRLGSLFTQVFPLLAVKAGGSVDALMMSYSVGFIVFYLLGYMVCGSLLRRYDYAIALLLFHILFVSETFYYIPSELPQGVTFLFIVFSLLPPGNSLQVQNKLRLAITAVCIVIATFFHPMVAVVWLYAVVFFWLRQRQAAIPKSLALASAVFFVAVIIKSATLKTQYDAHSMSGLKNFWLLFPNYFTTYSNKLFLQNVVAKYCWIPLCTTLIIAHYYRSRQYLQGLVFAASMIGYFFLVNISYPTPDTPSYYRENLYLPLGFFMALSLVFDVLPSLHARQMALPFFMLIVVSGGIRFYTNHNAFTDRLNWQRAFMQQNGDRKVIADAQKTNAGILQMLWGTPYEFWLLSTSERRLSASIIIDADPHHRDWARDVNKCLIVNWNMWYYHDLNPKYFRYPDSVSIYVVDPEVMPVHINQR